MKNRTVLVISWLLLLAGVYSTDSNAQDSDSSLDKNKRTMELVAATGKGDRSKHYLDSLMLAHRAPLVLVQSTDSVYFFVPNRGCYLRRHSRGSYEERNAGGDSQLRGKGGDDSQKGTGGVFARRSADGGSVNRDTGGDIAERETGGDESDRKQAGSKAKRTEGGEITDRNLKGDKSERMAAGKNKQRTEGGETTDRDTKGEKTNRATEGANRRRNWNGAFKLRKKGAATDENVYCQKDLTQPAFQLSNLPNGVTIEVYDVMGRRKVEGMVVSYY